MGSGAAGRGGGDGDGRGSHHGGGRGAALQLMRRDVTHLLACGRAKRHVEHVGSVRAQVAAADGEAGAARTRSAERRYRGDAWG